jgi:hypothetical protein
MKTFITKLEIEVEIEAEFSDPKNPEILVVRDTKTGKQIFGLSNKQLLKLQEAAADEYAIAGEL